MSAIASTHVPVLTESPLPGVVPGQLMGPNGLPPLPPSAGRSVSGADVATPEVSGRHPICSRSIHDPDLPRIEETTWSRAQVRVAKVPPPPPNLVSVVGLPIH